MQESRKIFRLRNGVDHFQQRVLIGNICNAAAVIVRQPCGGVDIDIFHDIERQAVGLVDLWVTGILLEGNGAVLGGNDIDENGGTGASAAAGFGQAASPVNASHAVFSSGNSGMGAFRSNSSR